MSLFTITPMSNTVSLKTGQVYRGFVKVVNPDAATANFKYKAYVAPYSVQGEEYLADLASKNNHTMIADWITIENPEGELAPNEVREVFYTITVPESVPSGGQYAAIIIGEDSEIADNTVVNNVFEMASLVYADVEGETVHAGEIIENEMPGFVTSTPITLSAILTNEGNVHDYAKVAINVVDVFTGEVLVSGESDGAYEELIMPETTRLIQRDVSNKMPALGIVHIEQAIDYNGNHSVTEKNVFICPVWFMILVIVTILAIGVVVRKMIKKRKTTAARLQY